MGPTLQIVFDANDVNRLVDLWARVTCYRRQPPSEGFEAWDGFAREHGIPEDQWDGWGALIDPDGKPPRPFFQEVPERKTAKNRVPRDISVRRPRGRGTDRTREGRSGRVERLGATRQREAHERGEFWIVSQDPGGDEFCLQ